MIGDVRCYIHLRMNVLCIAQLKILFLSSLLDMTSFQLMVPLRFHNATKILRVTGPLDQLLSGNEYVLKAKIDRLARKISFVKKPSKWPFLSPNLGYLTLEGPGPQTVNIW